MRAIFVLTDFGVADAYAGICEAVIAGIAPAARVIHLTHGIAPQDLRNASWQLWSATPHLPAGSIVLAIVDPGVGSARAPIAAAADRLIYVGPDNGLFGCAWRHDPPRRVVELADPRFHAPVVSRTFHGRDVFAPAAAHLARGVDPTELGPARDPSSLAALDVAPTDGAEGEIWTFDHYGNAITTLRERPIDAVRIGARRVPFATHYAAVELGEPIALIGSSGLIEVSVRDGSARAALGLVAGERVRVEAPIRARG